MGSRRIGVFQWRRSQRGLECAAIQKMLANHRSVYLNDRDFLVKERHPFRAGVNVANAERGPAAQQWRQVIDELFTQMAAAAAVDPHRGLH